MFTQEDSPVEFKFDSSCGDSSGNDSQDQGGDNNASSDPALQVVLEMLHMMVQTFILSHQELRF